MTDNMHQVLALLMAERDELAAKVAALNAAITALGNDAWRVPKASNGGFGHGAIPVDEVRRLHGQFMNDREIADAVGCSPMGVFGVRKRLGMPANFARRRRTRFPPAAQPPAAVPCA